MHHFLRNTPVEPGRSLAAILSSLRSRQGSSLLLHDPKINCLELDLRGDFKRNRGYRQWSSSCLLLHIGEGMCSIL